MKIVHELYNDLQIGGVGIRPYSSHDGSLPESGYLDEILILSPLQSGGSEDEVLYIEGDLQVVYHGLKRLLDIIEFCAQDCVDKGTLSPTWKDAGLYNKKVIEEMVNKPK